MDNSISTKFLPRTYLFVAGSDFLKSLWAYTVRYSIVIPMRGDITSQSDLQSISSHIKNEVGYINVLVANAGATGPMLKDLKPRHTLSEFVDFAWKTPMHEFSDTYALNCTATYYTILAFLELLDEGNQSRYQGGKSQVIATASTASFLRDPRAGYAYLSSKAAVISLIKSFSTFCVPWGIRFNAIAAGCPLFLCLFFFFFLPLNSSHLSRTFHSLFGSNIPTRSV